VQKLEYRALTQTTSTHAHFARAWIIFEVSFVCFFLLSLPELQVTEFLSGGMIHGVADAKYVLEFIVNT
jgi:hypothetical protein